MICNRCNTENPQGTAFCRECGNPLSSVVNLRKEESGNFSSNPFESTSSGQASGYVPVENSFHSEQNPYEQNPYPQQQYYQSQNNQQPYSVQQDTKPYELQMPNYPVLPNPDEGHMTALDWIGRYCITLIPFVGPIIYFVMIFVWAFGDTPKKSLKTWAQAQLIMMAVGIVIMLFFMLVAGVSFSDIADEIRYY